MNIKQIDHTGITVSDIEKSIRFYRDVMGFRLLSPPSEPVDDETESIAITEEKGAVTRVCTMEVCEGSVIELLEFVAPDSPVTNPMPMYTLGKHHIAYQVDDLDAWIDRLKSAGVEFTSEPVKAWEENMNSWIMCKDPDGIMIELVEASKQ